MKKIITLLFCVGMAGCVGENTPPAHIAVEVAPAATRGEPIASASQIASLGLFCSSADDGAILHDRHMVRHTTAGALEYADGQPAPWGGGAHSLHAYAPHATGTPGNGIVITSAAASPGTPTLSYTLPIAVEDQPDLMVAIPRHDIHPTGHTITLQMCHALTAVGFRASGNGERITGVSVSGIETSGHMAIDGSNIVWTNLQGSSSPTPYHAAIARDPGVDYFVAGPERDLLTGDGWLMMIPQEPTDNAVVHLALDDGSQRDYPLKFDPWLAGQRVTYRIALSPAAYDVSITPATLNLDAKTQFPATQTLTVACTPATGYSAEDIVWTISSDQPWLTLSLLDYPGSAAHSLSGNGTRAVYIFVRMNTGAAQRVAKISLDGNVACTITQEGI